MMSNTNPNRKRGLSEALTASNKRHKADICNETCSPISAITISSKNDSNRQACLYEKINGKTRADVVLLRLKEYNEQNMKFNSIKEVKIKLRADLAAYGF